MKIPFIKKKKTEPKEGMTRQQIIPKGVSSVVRSKEEIYNQARVKTDHDEPKLELQPKVHAFLRRHNAHPDDIDKKALTQRLVDAMEAGLRGEEGGLPMLPTYLTSEGSKAPNGRPVAVLDAGGTNLRAAQVIWREGTPRVEMSEISPLPGSKEEVTWNQFIKECFSVTH